MYLCGDNPLSVILLDCKVTDVQPRGQEYEDIRPTQHQHQQPPPPSENNEPWLLRMTEDIQTLEKQSGENTKFQWHDGRMTSDALTRPP